MSLPARSSLPRVVFVIAASTILTIPTFSMSQTPEQLTAGAASVPDDRVNGWRHDIAFWLEQLRKQHYIYKSKPLPPSLVKAAADLSRNVPRFSDERVLFEMQRLAALLSGSYRCRSPGLQLDLDCGNLYVARIPSHALGINQTPPE